jgi:hypothetical protein
MGLSDCICLVAIQKYNMASGKPDALKSAFCNVASRTTTNEISTDTPTHFAYSRLRHDTADMAEIGGHPELKMSAIKTGSENNF